MILIKDLKQLLKSEFIYSPDLGNQTTWDPIDSHWIDMKLSICIFCVFLMKKSHIQFLNNIWVSK